MYKISKNLQNYSYKNIENLSEKRVILRACLNVDVDDEGRVTDDSRIKEAIPGIKYFAENAKQVIILAHLGRPKAYSRGLSFWNVAEVLKIELNMDIEFVPFGNNSPMTGKIVLGDNIRFFEGEESENAEERMSFAKELAALGDVFVNDAFPDYRESASTYDLARILPSYIGPNFLEEVEALSKFSDPEHPFVTVIGGAKLSEKLDTLKALAETADKILVGGAMAYTLLKAKGLGIGNSLFEPDKLEVSKEIIDKYSDKILLPTDHVVSDLFTEESSENAVIIDELEIPNGKTAIDIGPDTIQLYKDEILKAGSILWNGPMGVFEWGKSELGTRSIIDAIISNTNAYKLAGGGDSIAAINKFNLSGFDHISTGGGAMLAFLTYDNFPTLDVISSSE